MLKQELRKIELLKGNQTDTIVRSVMLKKQLNIILQYDRTDVFLIHSIIERLDHPNERVYILALVQGQELVRKYLN